MLKLLEFLELIPGRRSSGSTSAIVMMSASTFYAKTCLVMTRTIERSSGPLRANERRSMRRGGSTRLVDDHGLEQDGGRFSSNATSSEWTSSFVP